MAFIIDGGSAGGSGSGGTGTVTNVSVVTANGISGSVTNPTTTPAITLTLGDITPSSVTISTLTAGSVIFAGTGGILSQDNASFFYDSTNKRLGVGVTAPATTLHGLSTTEQLRLGYDATNWGSFIVDSAGRITIQSYTSSSASTANSTIFPSGITTVSTTTNANLGIPSGSGNGTASGTAAVLFAGATNVNARRFFRGSGVNTTPVGNSVAGSIFGSESITTGASGTSALLANVVIKSLGTVTLSGTSTATAAASLYVEGNSTGATLNYGIWALGTTRLDGTTSIAQASADYFVLTGGTGTITDTATGSSADININLVPKGAGRLQSNGVTVPTISSSDALTGKTYNGLTITTTSGAFTLTNAKTLSVTNTLTLSGTDGTTMTFPTTTATIARTDAANTFTGASTTTSWVNTTPKVVTSINPNTDDGATLGDTTHNFSDLFLATGAVINYQNGNVVITHSTGILTMGTGEMRITTVGTNTASVVTVGGSQSLTGKTYNGLTLTTTTGTFTLTNGKTLSVTNTLTLSGTDSTTMTFPTTTATIARTDAAQTFTGTQTFSQIVTTNNAITASANAATVPITSRLSTVTNNSAATLTITITTTSAVDGQMIIVRVLDFSAAAQTITWVNTENSTVSAPTTSNGSTTLPKTVGFMYNNATSKRRCIASA